MWRRDRPCDGVSLATYGTKRVLWTRAPSEMSSLRRVPFEGLPEFGLTGGLPSRSSVPPAPAEQVRRYHFPYRTSKRYMKNSKGSGTNLQHL